MKALLARLGGAFVASLTETHGRSPFNLSGVGVPRGRIAVDRLHGWDLTGFPRACFVASIFLALGGCGATNVISTAGSGFTSGDAMDTVRNSDFSARFPVANEGNPGNPSKPAKPSESTQPFLFPGSDVTPERQRDRDPEMRTA